MAQGGRKEEEQCLAAWGKVLWLKFVLRLIQDFICLLWITRAKKQRKFWIKLSLLSNRSLCLGCLVEVFFFCPRALFTYNADASYSSTEQESWEIKAIGRGPQGLSRLGHKPISFQTSSITFPVEIRNSALYVSCASVVWHKKKWKKK